MGETFYDVLEVGADATQAEIEVAYRERVKETHPDLNDAPDASEAFQRVQTAEEVLGNPDERARYDRLGHASYTSHFGATEAGGGSRWDVGTDRRADDDGFGFDPDAYDRTQGGTASGSGASNASRRSYDVSGASGGTDDTSADASASASATGATTSAGGSRANATGANADGSGANATGSNADGGGASASTGAASGGFGDPTDGRHWREREHECERERSTAGQHDGRDTRNTRHTRDADDEPGGYSVHDWDEDDLDTTHTPYRLQGSEMVVVGITFVLYPFIAFSAITPQFSLVVNAIVAACALLLTGYLLTMPRIAIYVFGAWSVIAPLAFLAVPALEFVSLLGIVVLAATWIPFGYSVAFMRVLR